MKTPSTGNCTHLNQRLRWLGMRRDHGRDVYLFQCKSCGRTVTSQTAMTFNHETDALVKLATLAHA